MIVFLAFSASTFAQDVKQDVKKTEDKKECTTKKSCCADKKGCADMKSCTKEEKNLAQLKKRKQ